MSSSLQPHGLYSPWNSAGQNTGVGSLSLLQGIFPTQGLNPCLPHCWWILYQLSHKGSPKSSKVPILSKRKVKSLINFRLLLRIHAEISKVPLKNRSIMYNLQISKE